MGSSKEYNQQYYLKNKDKILEKEKERYQKRKPQKSTKAKEWYNKNKDKVKQSQQDYYKENKEKVLVRTKQQYLSNIPGSFEKRLLNSARNRAKRSNLDFNLSLQDIVIPNLCVYLNIPLTTIVGKGKVMSNASIDRIDSTKGYTKDNIQIISWKANIMKQDASIETLIKFAEGVLQTHAGRTFDNQTSSET